MWKLPAEFTENMRNRMADMGQESKPESLADTPERGPYRQKVDVNDNKFGSPPPELKAKDVPDSIPTQPDYKGDYRFSVGHLPTWAKKQVCFGKC